MPGTPPTEPPTSTGRHGGGGAEEPTSLGARTRGVARDSARMERMPRRPTGTHLRDGAASAGSTGPVGLTTTTARAVLGTPDSAARADQVAERLARAIQLGLVLEGERLPPESQLADELGTATVTLREALATLRGRGLVETRRGRGGGTFVTRGTRERDPGALAPPGQDDLLRDRLRGFTIVGLRGLGDHRQAISGMCAALAAQRAIAPEVTRLEHRLRILEAAETTSERRRAETQLALEIAAAAQSAALVLEELQLHARLGDLPWYASDDAHHAAVVVRSRKLLRAIGLGRATRARRIAETAVRYDTERLVELRIGLYREDDR